jgi:hypothetical protein
MQYMTLNSEIPCSRKIEIAISAALPATMISALGEEWMMSCLTYMFNVN